MICFKDGKQVYADLLVSKLKIFNKEKFKLINFKKSSQYLTTKEMYFDILRKNYINVCQYKEALNLLKSIKNKNFFLN